jgi:hypothetical protein
MIDIKNLRDNIDIISDSLLRRGYTLDSKNLNHLIQKENLYRLVLKHFNLVEKNYQKSLES